MAAAHRPPPTRTSSSGTPQVRSLEGPYCLSQSQTGGKLSIYSPSTHLCLPMVLMCACHAVFGPDDTPWEGGIFSLRITFTEHYPEKPPRVRFTSEMFHPNVYG